MVSAATAAAGDNRPLLHYTPEKGWMNDPNGLFYDKKADLWHIYFQYNPHDPFWNQPLYWGHATSKDLTTWNHEKLAISPDRDDEGIFSGSIVIDHNNTSGFFDDSIDPDQRVVAIYTNNADIQTQDLAYSLDGGYTFTKFHNNPVLDVNSTQFRDPKVFWHQHSNQWIMVVVKSQEYKVQIFGSPDLKDWKFHSNFTAGYPGFQFECPGLIEIPITGTNESKWVMFIAINPGSPVGGSTNQYFIGDFDGVEFKPIDHFTRFVDLGKDYYALQTFSDVEKADGFLAIAWASNWQYANNVPTKEWRSSLSLTRNFSLDYVAANPESKLLTLIQTPVFQTDVAKTLKKENITLSANDSIDFEADSGVFEFELKFKAINALAHSDLANLDLYISSTDGKESIRFGYDPVGQSFYLDRSNTPYKNPYFTGQLSAYVEPSSDGQYKIYGVVDRNIIELYFNDGVTTMTNTFFMSEGNTPSRAQLKTNFDDEFFIESISFSELSV